MSTKKSKPEKRAAEVTIPEEDYEEFLRESKILAALVDAGVEDWEGYELAMESIEDDEDDEDEGGG